MQRPPGWESRLYALNGVTLHAVEAGPADGPLVVLLHGFPEFWWGWRGQIGRLADLGFRVLAPDQRGYGRSDKPAGIGPYRLDRLAGDVAGLIRAAGRAKAHVVGHDWGGIVAWRVAMDHAGLVDRLAILNAPHPAILGPYARRHPSQALRSAYVALFQLPALPEAMLRADGHRRLADAMQGTSRPGTISAEDLAAYRAAWAEPGALTAMLNWYRALRLAPPRPALVRVRPPTLVIWGERDRFLEAGLAEASLDLCDDGQVRWFPDATHWVHLEEAQAVSRALERFFREDETPAP